MIKASMYGNDNKLKELGHLFSKFSNQDYQYGQDGLSVVRYPLTPDGKRIHMYEVNRWDGDIRGYDKSYNVANIITSNWDYDFDVSFVLTSEQNDNGKPIKFDYLYKFHSNEFFVRLKKHLKLLNDSPEMHRKRELVEFESTRFKVSIFYRYDISTKIVSRCAELKFKAFNGMLEHRITVLNDDHRFLAAMDEMEQEFQERYYRNIIERKKIERGSLLNKTEQNLIKMVYY
jgi:hypothetical protein